MIMQQQHSQKIPQRRQFKLCLLSFLVVWGLSSTLAFLRVEGGWRFPFIFLLISIFEAFFFAPVSLTFYWLNQKLVSSRGSLYEACSRMVMGGALGALSGFFQYFFHFRGVENVQEFILGGSQGVALGALYSIFQFMGLFKGQAGKGKETRKLP